MMAFLDRFNRSSAEAAQEEIRACCGSHWWCAQMVEGRPFQDVDHLHDTADEVFDRMDREAWLEAFAAHPRIGDAKSLKMELAGNRQWSSNEQLGVASADDGLLRRLHEANDTYYSKFGFTFIVCATGKSATEMLALLETRLSNARDQELTMAAAEQRRITHLRIDKLASSPPNTESTSS